MIITKKANLSFRWKLFTCLLLTIFADFLFFGHAAGWTLGLFGCAVIAFFIFHNSRHLKSGTALALIFLSLGQCIALFERQNTLALILMVLGIASLAVIKRRAWQDNSLIWLRSLFSFFISFRHIRKSAVAFRRARRRMSSPYTVMNFLRGWFLPLFLSGVFLILFSQANPVVMQWFEGMNFSRISEFLSFSRMFFWLCVTVGVFCTIRPAIWPKKQKPPSSQKSRLAWMFSKESVTRSLVVFNIIFAFQTVMDINYLWQGRALPEGITYAEYAHKGAYPLIFTALLAGLFVLMTQRAGKEVSGSRGIKALIYLWISQNILLVLSSIFRNILYVEIYSLTYLRVAAFIWMGLVAAGLVWLIIRIVLDKSEIWLINANVLMLFSVLYITSFVNTGGIIAMYNVTHATEITAKGRSLDFAYLKELGAVSIPALEFLKNHDHVRLSTQIQAHNTLIYLKANLKSDMKDWRHWTYREYRVLKSFEE